jgi:uncharacterized RDD family membrane protein YckC
MNDVLQPGERYAGFWIRFVAFVVDSTLVSIVIGPIVAVLYEKPGAMAVATGLLSAEHLSDALIQLFDLFRPVSVGDFLLNVVVPAAGVIAFWMYRSATPGKMATRTRIADAATGGPPSKQQCVVRYLGYFVSIFGLGLGFLWVAFDRRKQGWHDKLAGTVVIRLAPEIT